MKFDAYRTKRSPDGKTTVIYIPTEDIGQLYRGLFTLLGAFKGAPLASTPRGAMLRKLAYAIRYSGGGY